MLDPMSGAEHPSEMFTRTRSAALAATCIAALLSGCGSNDTNKATPVSGEATNTATATPGEHATGEHALAELTADEVEARIAKNDGTFFVYDCNQREVFDAGHVPTAKFLSYRNMTDADLTPNKDADLVFYCANEH